MKILQTKKSRIFFAILMIILLIRIAMPYLMLQYVENSINQIPEYKVTIADLDVHFLKGSYVIKRLRLQKIRAHIPVPFFSARRIEFAIEWSALLKGALVSQIRIDQPHLNFVIDPNGNEQQLTISAQWRDIVKAIFPLYINHMVVHNGELSFRSFTSKPPFNLYFKQVNAELTNLRNVTKSSDKLPSSLNVKAQTMDGAPFNLQVDFDPFKKSPTFKLVSELKQMQVPAANNFLRHYTKLDIKQGSFSLYVEVAAANGKVNGYAKPLIKNLQVTEPNKNDLSPIEALYKGAVQVIANILENPETKKVATKVNIYGNIDDPDMSIWSIISNLLKNAFIQALLPQIDHSVKMKDVNLSNKTSFGAVNDKH